MQSLNASFSLSLSLYPPLLSLISLFHNFNSLIDISIRILSTTYMMIALGKLTMLILVLVRWSTPQMPYKESTRQSQLPNQGGRERKREREDHAIIKEIYWQTMHY